MRAGGTDEREAKACGIRKLERLLPSLKVAAEDKENANAAVERRKARRLTLWAGSPVR